MKRWGLTLSILTVVSFYGAGVVYAQSVDSRFEVGALASFLRLSTFDTANAGFGGRVSFDLTPWVALEAEADFFPNDDVLEAPSTLTPNLRVAYERRRANPSGCRTPTRPRAPRTAVPCRWRRGRHRRP